MLLELLILLELLAFIFLILGLFPYQKSVDFEGNEGNPPYMNKIIFIAVGMILFFSLGILSTQYDYNYCYINQTTADYSLNQSTSTATCNEYIIQSLELSYLNYGMGLLSFLLLIIISIFAALNKNVVKD